VFAAALFATVPALLAQLQRIIEDAPNARDRMVALLDEYPAATPFAHALESVPVDDLVVRAGNALLPYSRDILAGLGYAVTTAFLAIYLLADPHRARGLLFQLVPRHHHVKLARILRELVVIVGGYMRGQLITSVAIGAFMFGLMSLLRVSDALAISVFAALTDVIPFIGGYLASAPAVFAVAGRGAPTIVAVVVAMIVYQEFESRVLVPKVYGKVLRMSPAAVLVALLIGGTLMGIIGALLALPIAATVRLLVRELRVELPGVKHDGHDRDSDARDEQQYEQLSDGAPPTEAPRIADAVATHRTEPQPSRR
jgi:predicted PurR-regulated permease PerM